MHESVAPRTGVNPITQDALAPPGALPTANPINGHEWTNAAKTDLQYACIFPLKDPDSGALAPKDCSVDGANCDCGSLAADKPLCQDPQTGQTDPKLQFYAKGYPGLRELETLKEYGNNSIVASICPKVQTPGNPDYGYNPAVAAIIERLKSALSGKCLPRVLSVDPVTGLVPCAVVEAQPVAQGLDCSRPGRTDLGSLENGVQLRNAVEAQLKGLGVCGGTGQPSCAAYSMCGIDQFDPNSSPAALEACQKSTTPDPGYTGYCYVADNAQGQHIGNPALLDQQKCKATERQILRFIGGDPAGPLPASGASYFIACTGASFSTGGGGASSPDGG